MSQRRHVAFLTRRQECLQLLYFRLARRPNLHDFVKLTSMAFTNQLPPLLLAQPFAIVTMRSTSISSVLATLAFFYTSEKTSRGPRTIDESSNRDGTLVVPSFIFWDETNNLEAEFFRPVTTSRLDVIEKVSKFVEQQHRPRLEFGDSPTIGTPSRVAGHAKNSSTQALTGELLKNHRSTHNIVTKAIPERRKVRNSLLLRRGAEDGLPFLPQNLLDVHRFHGDLSRTRNGNRSNAGERRVTKPSIDEATLMWVTPPSPTSLTPSSQPG